MGSPDKGGLTVQPTHTVGYMCSLATLVSTIQGSNIRICQGQSFGFVNGDAINMQTHVHTTDNCPET